MTAWARRTGGEPRVCNMSDQAQARLDQATEDAHGAPRFEFRVWGEPASRAAIRLRNLSSQATIKESTETYFVAVSTVGANPKVREDQLDIKTLLAVRDGCEQWGVHLKAAFPVAADVLASDLFGLLGVEPPALDRPAFSLTQLVDEVIAACEEMAAVEVAKHRELHELQGCFAEIAEVAMTGTPMSTVALESTDLGAVDALRRALGLEQEANSSYPRAIRAALGGSFALS